VGGTLSLITFIGYTSQLFVILPSRSSSPELLWLLGPFNILLGVLYWNYYLCWTTDPGRVPSDWVSSIPTGSSSEELMGLEGRLLIGPIWTGDRWR
jgi:hypothetical protein